MHPAVQAAAFESASVAEPVTADRFAAKSVELPAQLPVVIDGIAGLELDDPLEDEETQRSLLSTRTRCVRSERNRAVAG